MMTINATDNQLELGFNPDMQRRDVDGMGRESRIARADWWFGRMRAIVASAMDWSATGAPRPEQIWLPGARHEVKV